ncbi:MAG: polysaccharide deacetylase family protein [Desulfomonilia bacterium]
MPPLALKIDVDTYRGMKLGIPELSGILERFNIRGSFFISFGPDRSGLAMLQLFRPKFIKKMLRTNAPGLYGLKTLLYGTMLPAPMIGKDFPDQIRSLSGLGHEIACHAWDHRLWQDWLPLMRGKTIDEWFTSMVDAYEEILGRNPEAFGAPGWVMDSRALERAKAHGFLYLSCTRADTPFLFRENSLVEIPSNLPCIEEVGVEGVLSRLREQSNTHIPQVLPVHAEVEGGLYRKEFEIILKTAISYGYELMRVRDITHSIDTASLPIRELRMGMIPGRAFPCAI